ncbi:hypothetical protein K8I85_16030 [bacterium]|nr:hypothetical protein [bacterium]
MQIRARFAVLFLCLCSATLALLSVGCSRHTDFSAAPQPVDPDALPPTVGAMVGNSMPGTWRPFSDTSPWNTPIAPDVQIHPLHVTIMTYMTRTTNVRFGNSYLPPFWVVESYDRMTKYPYHSAKIFDPWDCCPKDSVADVLLPIAPFMYEEPTSDSHITILDRQHGRFFECSYFDWFPGFGPVGTTFNIWDEHGDGYGTPFGWDRWQLQGGRGSGVPVIAGLLRPEEIEAGEIRHALAFTFANVRMGDNGENLFLWPPAARSDGKDIGEQFPIEGMRFQLWPTLDDTIFDLWGLDEPTRVVARALQTYGAYLVDRGGDWAFQVQLLGRTKEESRDEWDARFPTLYDDIQKIPAAAFRVVYTGEPTSY